MVGTSDYEKSARSFIAGMKWSLNNERKIEEFKEEFEKYIDKDDILNGNNFLHFINQPEHYWSWLNNEKYEFVLSALV